MSLSSLFDFNNNPRSTYATKKQAVKIPPTSANSVVAGQNFYMTLLQNIALKDVFS